MSDAPVPAKASRPTPRQKLEIAHEAHLSLRAVDDYFRGKQQRDNTRGHLEGALRRLNLEHLAQPSTTAPAATAGR
jgi:hypothetical protein